MMNLRLMEKGLANESIVEGLMRNWQHEKETLRFWRASSNFVFAFSSNEHRFFLRYNHESEKSIPQFEAQLDFMSYLSGQGFPVVQAVPTRMGHYIQTVETEEGTYVGVVFREANGMNLEVGLTEEKAWEWGKALAHLHSLSSDYQTESLSLKSHETIVAEIQAILDRHPEEREAFEELGSLKAWFSSLPISKENYGLIHYDFQHDNLFYNEKSRTYEAIDFDDAFYAWYVLDIVTALDGFLHCSNDSVQTPEVKAFLTGYRSIRPIEESLLKQAEYFHRFANLYKFARLLRSLEGTDPVNMPDWLKDVVEKFAAVRDRLRKGFNQI
ncbi:hypothetical protein A8F94_19055 [Bacillus sp. FJAT-27225]|uniref:phosphotransferase enzyme family protein n=1 Tax=Bacillus sp. FJAT-27225 TaxID=1743144 RepID=UPI00080C2AE5|nr:phosphotransferase [Bacillus sp. FJAT-27225]OCA83212.1 hypothetical protein A8F94_19055 [Bacillus sp. FJAT-27225]